MLKFVGKLSERVEADFYQGNCSAHSQCNQNEDNYKIIKIRHVSSSADVAKLLFATTSTVLRKQYESAGAWIGFSCVHFSALLHCVLTKFFCHLFWEHMITNEKHARMAASFYM